MRQKSKLSPGEKTHIETGPAHGKPKATVHSVARDGIVILPGEYRSLTNFCVLPAQSDEPCEHRKPNTEQQTTPAHEVPDEPEDRSGRKETKDQPADKTVYPLACSSCNA
jgi:hypothetical protein